MKEKSTKINWQNLSPDCITPEDEIWKLEEIENRSHQEKSERAKMTAKKRKNKSAF